jgi:DNA-binding winged helix-turn-helix (wHTH) protein
VTVHVRRLRGKVEDDPARPCLIRTVWGVGYRFDPTGSETTGLETTGLETAGLETTEFGTTGGEGGS